jgi:hypothetical protein
MRRVAYAASIAMATPQPSNERENLVAGLHSFGRSLIVRSPLDCICGRDTTSFVARFQIEGGARQTDSKVVE